jgi:hypothetical protein
MILAKREGIASEEAMQQPGTIAAIYSLFSKSDGLKSERRQGRIFYLRKAADKVTTYRSGRYTLNVKIIADEALLPAR